MRHYAKILRATLMASLMLIAIAEAAVAGPYEDALAALKRGDYAIEYSLLRPLADQGNAAAQELLGDMYALGEFVPQDYVEAVKWFQRAADQDNDMAQAQLGGMYKEGHGVPQDYAMAVKWFKVAADKGNAAAQLELGFMYGNGYGVPQDYVQAHMWYNLAASRFNQAFEQKYRDRAIKSRDALASMMTATQIADAQKLAGEWKPKR
jgi:TPR repeat protein